MKEAKCKTCGKGTGIKRHNEHLIHNKLNCAECVKDDIPRQIRVELEHLEKTGVPRCPRCKVNFVNGYDSIAKEISKYLWIPNCKCKGMKSQMLSIG